MNPSLEAFSQRLGHSFRQRELLVLALTHRSYGADHNERLEFLGDAVLNLAVSDLLFDQYDDSPEGDLTRIRAHLVRQDMLHRIALSLGIPAMLRLSEGEARGGGAQRPSILADAMEAIIGAVYLQIGLEGARAFILERFGSLIDAVSHLGAGLDWKTSLQELVAGLGEGPPEYVVSGEGPDHDRVFTAQVRIGGQLYGHGAGKTKKQAEQLAAEGAFAQLQDRSPGDA